MESIYETMETIAKKFFISPDGIYTDKSVIPVTKYYYKIYSYNGDNVLQAVSSGMQGAMNLVLPKKHNFRVFGQALHSLTQCVLIPRSDLTT